METRGPGRDPGAEADRHHHSYYKQSSMSANRGTEVFQRALSQVSERGQLFEVVICLCVLYFILRLLYNSLAFILTLAVLICIFMHFFNSVSAGFDPTSMKKKHVTTPQIDQSTRICVCPPAAWANSVSLQLIKSELVMVRSCCRDRLKTQSYSKEVHSNLLRIFKPLAFCSSGSLKKNAWNCCCQKFQQNLECKIS